MADRVLDNGVVITDEHIWNMETSQAYKNSFGGSERDFMALLQTGVVDDVKPRDKTFGTETTDFALGYIAYGDQVMLDNGSLVRAPYLREVSGGGTEGDRTLSISVRGQAVIIGVVTSF